MKLSALPLSTLLACLVLAVPAWAERADRDKPMNIESDALRYDDAKQTSVFTGKVVASKGTILMRGARLDVRQDTDGNQFGMLTAEPGKLAFFRQKRDTPAGAPDEFMEGEGEVIDYDGKADVVKFHRRAQLRRYIGSTLYDEITGSEIAYDNNTSVLTVDGGPAKPNGDGSSRVRTMLTPRVVDAGPATPGAAASAAKAAAPAPALRRSTDLAGPKK
ncbi:MAG: lipopolysaccharide transport periplasmic protein LptA [Burkholderiaceae bacterium]